MADLKYWQDRFVLPLTNVKVLDVNEYESLIEDQDGTHHWVSNQRLGKQQQQPNQGQGQDQGGSSQDQGDPSQEDQGQGAGGEEQEFKIQQDEEVTPTTWEDGNNIKLLLQNILRDNRSFRKQRRLKNGKLDLKSLTSIFTGSDRLFEKRKKLGKKEYYIGIVADASGSMHKGEREEVIKSVKKIESMMGGWCDFHLTSFGNRSYYHGKNGFEEFYNKYFGYAGGTNTTRALRDTINEMKNCSPDRSFIIVLTDGEADDPATLRTEINQCDFPVLGIGIGQDAKVDDFDHGEKISSGTELNKALEKFFRRSIKRRH